MQSMKSFATCLAVTVAIVAVSSRAQAQSAQGRAANPAAEHLTAARAALNKVLNSPAPTGDAFTKLSQLKTEYIAMEKAASTASPQWKTHYETITRLLTDLVGAPNAAEPGAVGTSGSAGAPMAAALTANLLDFRTHLTAFSTAMGNVAPAAAASAPAAAASAAPAPAAPPAASAAPATPPPSTEATPAAASAAPAPTSAEPAAPASAPAAASAAPAATMPAAADASVINQLDQVVGMVDGVLKANAAQSSGTVSIERSMLEQIKTQLEQVKASLKKQ